MHQVREGGPQRSGDYCKAWLQREGLEQTQQDAEGVEAWAAEATSYAKGASKGIYKLLKHTKATFSLVSGEITTDGHEMLLSSMRFRCELRPRLLTWARCPLSAHGIPWYKHVASLPRTPFKRRKGRAARLVLPARMPAVDAASSRESWLRMTSMPLTCHHLSPLPSLQRRPPQREDSSFEVDPNRLLQNA